MAPPRNRRFAYYERLSTEGKRSYRKSDAIHDLPLGDAAAVRPVLDGLRQAIAGGDRAMVQAAAMRLVRALLDDLGVPMVDVEVLEARPRGDYGELHGLYTMEAGARPRVQVWMRTAAKGQVVAWKTFVRTVLHEVCHHLDYHYLGLEDSLHTQGFYRRETDIFRQLYVDARQGPARVPGRGGALPQETERSPGPAQLSLPGLER